ncbi:hypothetical protein TorRG33x02_218610 [Trema orientale]|uniref:Uncharacterized protein n=1 Tax=Trema orientale TaxID=63057 RepID=A0A2P5EA08_TREOI|nr:hypothetical protein TorRG33x02_218610 [Trema orientale]
MVELLAIMQGNISTRSPRRTGKVFVEIQKSSIIIAIVFNPPKPLLPTPISKAKLSNGGAIIDVAQAETEPKNFPARAQTLLSLSLSRAFLILRCYSSIDISPMVAGMSQFVHMGFLMASLINMFSARSLSFSYQSSEFLCCLSWVW